MSDDFLDRIRAAVRDREVRVRPRMALLKTLEELGPDAAQAELRQQLAAINRRIQTSVDQLQREARQ